ncbi:Sugar kinase of the NBD/HSP70 family, may contain an N-terminal HTH domain [Sinosporangium album]|uniref:Sugar kinase of the NBD/HSP70 family, may contain an N-terminal HTH domain n=1 Tax=Sinosporangium album TaxID=504805 RepID=A0A1G8AVW1_9ACTN|nr:ROK family transcriptional regulator [Sinosporangium album]SDH25101.1 Sugar kinase of the NBD/HSP70 family, may contain an N-terminal HTH domain [Sinosporangium album]
MRTRSDQLGNPRFLRVMNERLLLDHLLAGGPTSRADLAKITGLSKPTVSAALAGLEEGGLVHLAGRELGRPGPVTSLYDITADAAHVAGIDIGRDWIRVAVADLRGRFVGRRDGGNPARDGEELVSRVRELAHAAAADAGLDWTSVATAVVGSPGVYDREAARLVFAPNLPGWEGAGLVDRLKAALEVDTVIENDINLAAVGEHAYGVGQGKANFALVSIGTGVGMGIVVNGELYVGARGAAGEVSFLPASEPAGGDLAADRDVLRHGLTESAAAASGVVRAARAAGLDLSTAKEIFEAAAEGDPVALSVVEAEGRRVGGLIVAVAAVLDPELVVLAGGVGRNLDLFGDAIQRRFAELGPLRPTVVASTLGDSGVLLGAVARALSAAWNRILDSRQAGVAGLAR